MYSDPYWWQYFIALILLCFGYPLGARVGALAPDEIEAAGKYLFLVRDALVLAAVAVACYANGLTLLQYLIPAAIVVSFFWFWRYAERIYPFLVPLTLAAAAYSGAGNAIVIVGTLAFLATFTSGSLTYKQLEEYKAFCKYWPAPIVGIICTVLLLIL